MTDIENKEITKENVLKVDIAILASVKRSGSLVFEETGNKLLQIQQWLNEVQSLDLKKLIQDDVSYLRSTLRLLVEHLEWMRQFDPGAISDAKTEKERFDRNVTDFYNDVYHKLAKGLLTFLREEQRRLNPDQVKLDEELGKVIQLRKDMEGELASIRNETKEIRTTDQEISTAKGERAAVKLATHFSQEVKRYESRASIWFWVAIAGYGVIFIFIVKFASTTLGYLEILDDSEKSLNEAIVWSALLTKLVILGAAWYGLSFIVKNYNINSHLGAVNRHRSAVAGTLEDFIAFEDAPKSSEVLNNATEAMFKNVSIGYVTKAEKEAANPILQIFNDITGVKRD